MVAFLSSPQKNFYISIKRKTMNWLKVGETVRWKGSWGSDPEELAKIVRIEICPIGDKYGREVKKVLWSTVETKNVVVCLDNDHFAYGYQIKKK